MKIYEVTYRETLVHKFYVEANSIGEACAIFGNGCMNCEFDFSDGVVDETDYTIAECIDSNSIKRCGL